MNTPDPETLTNTVESFLDRIDSYSRTTFELSKLRLLETTAAVVTSLIPRLSAILMLAMFIFVLSMGFALFLGELLGKIYYGLFIVALFYLVAGLFIHFFLHGWIKKPISDLIIKQALREPLSCEK